MSRLILGHNNGPTMEPGAGFRRHAWGKARAELLPKLPVEIVRIRLKRAKELGINYKTYASIRANSGRDVIAFLFSTNALRVFSVADALPDDRAARLHAIKNCGRLLSVVPPMSTGQLLTLLPVDHAAAAPVFGDAWAELRSKTRAALDGHPAAGVVMIGDTGFERDCAEAARLGAYLPAEKFFGEEATS